MRKKVLSITIILIILIQIIVPIMMYEVQAAEEGNTENTEAVTTEYEIKEEETWDISANQDGSVMAKWTLKDRTLTITGTGEMKNWGYDSNGDWHNTKYTNVIEKVIIESGVTSIGSSAFEGCSSLTDIVIPEGVMRIGNYAFSGCSSLTNIVIPEGVTSIESWTFMDCSSLTSIVIPEGVTNIGYIAFYNCSSLTDIKIPEGVTRIEWSAFEGCSSLEAINVNSNNKYYVSENGILFNKNKTELINYPEGKKDVSKYVIPKGVTSIGRSGSAFEGCSSLTDIVIPEGVTSIGGEAFAGCSSLTDIVIPEGVTSIDSGTFYGCSSLTDIEIPETVTTIERGAFYGCSSLTDIKIPEGVTSIESWTFMDCSSLTSIVIPEGVTSIGEEAFRGCSSLTDIVIPEGVTSIGNHAFYECSSLTEIVIPEGVTSIGGGAFYGCSSLTDIVLPEGVTSIGDWAFSGCSSLTDIVIQEGVTSIGEGAIPKTALIYAQTDSEGHRYAEENKQGYILEGEGEASKITTKYEVKEEETWDISVNQDGSIMAKWTLKDRTLTITGTGEMKYWNYNLNGDWHKNQYTNVIKEVTIESGVTSIGNHAFHECSSLTDIVIPEGVTSIEYSAFEGCSSLTDIVIPEGVTSIGGGAFEGCSSLETINVNSNNKNYASENGILFNKNKSELIKYPEGKKDVSKYVIPKGVTSIWSSAFYECSSLTNIVIPEGVTSIENGTFEDCSSLTNIEIPEGVTSIGDRAFRECSSLTDIKIPEGVTSIGIYAFYNCSSLTNIEIPEGVTSIGDWAFAYCSSLTDIEIPEGVTEIGYCAFERCSSLTDIVIPEGVTSIWESAFEGCSSLTDIVIPDGVISIGEDAFKGSKIIIYTKTNSEGHRYAEEEKQGYILDNLGPNIKVKPNGMTSNKKQNVEIEVKVEDNMKEVGVKKGSIFYAISESNTESPSEEEFSREVIDGKINYEMEEGEKYIWIKAKDNVGNENKIVTEKFLLDTIPAETQARYSTTDPTKENVKVTMKANEPVQEIEGWVLSKDKLSLTKEYSKNVEEEIIVRDLVGNETKTNISIKNIDKIAPEVQVSYSTTEATKENVKVTITANEPIQEVEGWVLSEDKLSLTKEYSKNIEEEIIVRDLAENETKTNISIKNIDKTAPKAQVGYSTTEPTEESVKITITANEPIQGVEGWILSEDKLSLTKEYSNNIEEEIIVKDLAGNETKTNVIIKNIIDKIAAEAQVSYSTTDPTKENVKVTITANEPIQEIEGWVLSENKLSLTKEYSKNIEEEIIVRDLAENETKTNISIKNIDKTAPKAQVGYSTTEPTEESVKITITANEPIQEVEGWVLSENKLSLTKEYSNNIEEEIIVKDLAGNETKTNVIIKNIIDKIAAEAQVSYSTTDPTKENVKVTITANEPVQEIEGWVLSENKLSLTKEYSKNIEEEIIVRDLAENETKTNISIKNIDKTAPKAQVGYSTTEATKENVKVTIIANEPIQEVEGWVLSENKLSLTKEYSENIEEEIIVKDLVGNESTVKIQVKNINHPTKIKKGDINEDGKIDTTDMLKMLRHIAVSKSESIKEKHKDWLLVDNKFKTADIDNNQKIDTTDMLKLLRHIAASKNEETANKFPNWIISE